MGKKPVKPVRARRRTWRWAALGILGFAAVGGGFWWFSEAPDASGGTPRLALDRDTVDLGYLPFETPARAVFTLTNTGDGVLRLAEVPRVKAIKGC